MVLIKPFTLLPLAVGALAITTHEPVGKRDVLVEARRTCTRTGWIPACPGTYKCVPPGAICCSDGITYAMPPETCPDGQSALTTAPLTMVDPTASATSENTEPVASVTTTIAEITETDVTVTMAPTITDEVTEVTEVTEATETPTATTEEEGEETYISVTETETETGIVSVEPMPTDATTVQTDDVGTASWTLSITAGPGPGPNATVSLGGPTPTGEVFTAAAGRVRLAGGLVGLGVVGVVGVLV